MARLYYDLIYKNLKTIDNVPPRWRDEVRRRLEADNQV